ncbi:MAG: hypothetical protein VZR00_09545, partial [Lachnospiraceae bacterium]|nr:hypothetical protein [Lachnospiraceae bacterium]
MVKRNHHDTHMKQKGVQILRRGLTFALAVSMVLTLPTSSPVLFDLGSKAGTVKAASAAEEDPLVDRSFIKNENLYNAIYKLAYP